MKVLLLNGADQGGGSFQMAKCLMKYVPQYDESIRYVLVSQKAGPLNQWCDDNGIENYAVPYRYCVYRPTGNPVSTFMKHRAKMLAVSALNACALHKIEALGVLEGIDLIHTNINRDLFGMALSKKLGIPNITHLREFSRAHFHLEPLYKSQISFMNNNTAHFVAISNSVLEDWIDYGVDANNATVIYDGVDPDDVAKKTKRQDSSLRIVMSGGIYEGKGQLELAKAVVALLEENNSLDISVDYYGECIHPSYQAEIQAYIDERGFASHFHFKGYRDDVRTSLSHYDVGVVCSAAEGFGLATVEFLMAGLYVIATKTGANGEILAEGKYGCLYEPKSCEQLCLAIFAAYQKKEAGHLNAPEARRYAKQCFSIQRTAEQTAQLYASVAGERLTHRFNKYGNV